MEVMVERAAGLDVHQASLVASLLLGPAGGKPSRERRSFGTLRKDLEALADWLAEHGVTHVALESTGVYWLPVYEALEGRVTLILANAHHVKAVPGRKTDMADADWLATLARHGLIRPSFVPPKPQRELRVLTRERRVLVESLTRERNLVLKLLESANVKLASVLSDVFGVSGTAMLRALIEGRLSPAEMAALGKGRLRAKPAEIEAALDGRLAQAHRLALQLHVEQLDLIERQIAVLDKAIAAQLEPHGEILQRLCQIPGVDRTLAAVILAEIGPDVRAFEGAHRLAAWAGLCPGNNQSAGRAKSSRVRKGNVHLKTALVQAAVAAARCTGTYLQAKYHRLRSRCGPKRAAVAVAHKIVIAVYHMLARGVDYVDLGAAHLDRRTAARTTRRLVKRLQSLGYEVTLTALHPAPT